MFGHTGAETSGVAAHILLHDSVNDLLVAPLIEQVETRVAREAEVVRWEGVGRVTLLIRVSRKPDFTDSH